MDAQKVDQFMLEKGKFFPAEKTMYVKERLMQTDDSKEYLLNTVKMKDPTIVLVLSVLVGVFGIDRMFMGDIGMGILKLCTLGGFFIWWIVDIFSLPKKAKEQNLSQFMTLV